MCELVDKINQRSAENCRRMCRTQRQPLKADEVVELIDRVTKELEPICPHRSLRARVSAAVLSALSAF